MLRNWNYYITGKNIYINGAHALENTLADLQNVKCQATISPSNFTPTYITQENGKHVQLVHKGSQHIIYHSGKVRGGKHPSIDEWIREVCCIHTTEFYSE